MESTLYKTERITLALSPRSIKILKLLAVLEGKSQNEVAEDYLMIGGLHRALKNWKLDPAI